MSFTAQDVAKLRQQTGVGMMECKKALTDANGDFEKAIVLLRERGLKAVDKKQNRIASEGAVASYIHMGGKIGVLVEVNCETDFVAKSDDFQVLVKDIAMQIAAANPKYVREEEVDPSELEKEKEILKVQALNEGKPANIVERMIEGRIKKYYEDVCLLNQPFVKDSSKTIKDILTEATLKIGEKISVRRFVRYELGEGLEKRNDNLAEEVAKQMANIK
ncbi:MAG TPA: translation elongation factor Ts [Candidatus Caccovivens faecavium]|nr:translation elongation factor Ts [Candidatus Caccovivens faecavium]